MKKQLQESPVENTPSRIRLERSAPTNIVTDVVVHFDPVGITRFLSIFVALLTVVHTISLVLFYSLPDRNVPRLMFRMFDMGQDSNFPTLFSSFLLLGAAVLLFILFRIAKARNELQAKGRWFLLSMIFLFLCVDEGAQIHDVISNTVTSRLPFALPDYLWASWVIPYFVFALAVALYFARFLWRLPAKTRNLMVLSGCLYVGGALGFEMLESPELVNMDAENFRQGIKSYKVHVMETFEELLEMSGIVLFIYTLLDYFKKQGIGVRVRPKQVELG